MSITLLAEVAAAFFATVLLTAWTRKFALARGVLDVPNARSSHSAPTPRGGGLAIVMTVLPAVALLNSAAAIPRGWAAALLVGGAAVAMVGLIDDLQAVSPPARIAVHLGALAWCAWWLGPLPAVNLGFAVWN